MQGSAEGFMLVIDRRNGLLALDGFDAQEEPTAGGMQRGRAAGPLAKMVMYKFNLLNL